MPSNNPRSLSGLRRPRLARSLLRPTGAQGGRRVWKTTRQHERLNFSLCTSTPFKTFTSFPLFVGLGARSGGRETNQHGHRVRQPPFPSFRRRLVAILDERERGDRFGRNLSRPDTHSVSFRDICVPTGTVTWVRPLTSLRWDPSSVETEKD